jgi:hypothetical protein
MKLTLTVRNWGPDTVGVSMELEERREGIRAFSYIGTMRLHKRHWAELRKLIEYPSRIVPRNQEIPEVLIVDSDVPAGRA